MEVFHEQIVARAHFFCHAQVQFKEVCMVSVSFIFVIAVLSSEKKAKVLAYPKSGSAISA